MSVPASRSSELAQRIGPGAGLIDVGSGLGWARVQTDDLGPLRTWAESVGGRAVLYDVAPDVRAELGTWGTPPLTVELMRRMKREFDPDAILAPGRLGVV